MREIILWGLIAVSIPFVWRRPILGLTIYLGANIVRPEMLFWGGRAGSRIFIVYYALIVISSIFNGYLKRFGEVLHKEYLLMLWMISAVYLSIFFTQYHVERDYYYATELLKTIGLCALLYMLITDFTDIQRLQTILLGCFTFLGLWGIEQQFRGNDRLEGLGGSAWGDSNGVAAVFVLFLPVALARVYSSEKRRDFLVSLGIVAVMVALIICTKSRGGLLGLITCFLCFGFYARKTAKVIKITLILALLVSPFATESYFERMKTMQTTDTENIEGSARSRLILWQAGLMVFADNPLFGTGFLTYPEAKMKYEGNFLHLEDSFREAVFRKDNKKVTHSTYIQMLSDCGIAGAIPFFLLVAGVIHTGLLARGRLREKPEDRRLVWLSGFCAGFTGFAVCIITIDAILVIFLFVQLACIGILSRMTASEDQNIANVHLVAEGGGRD